MREPERCAQTTSPRDAGPKSSSKERRRTGPWGVKQALWKLCSKLEEIFAREMPSGTTIPFWGSFCLSFPESMEFTQEQWN